MLTQLEVPRQGPLVCAGMLEGSYLGRSWLLRGFGLSLFPSGFCWFLSFLQGLSLLSPPCGAGLGVRVTVFLSESMLQSELSLDLFCTPWSSPHPQPCPGCLHGSQEADEPELEWRCSAHSSRKRALFGES